MNAKHPDTPESRSARKRAAQALDELAQQLTALPEASFQRLVVPPELREEIVLARRTTAHSARKRQIKRLAGLLRHDEEAADTLRAQVDGDSAAHRQETARFHSLEQLRDRLCAAETAAAAWQEVARDFPSLNRSQLEALVQQVRSRQDRAAYRQLFRLLRQAAGTTQRTTD